MKLQRVDQQNGMILVGDLAPNPLGSSSLDTPDAFVPNSKGVDPC